MKFTCQFDCGYNTICYKRMIKHIWSFHSLLPNFAVKCGISGCGKEFQGERSYSRHIKSKHLCFFNNFMKNESTSSADTSLNNSANNEVIPPQLNNEHISDESDFEDNISINEENIPTDPYDFISNFDDIVADMLIELREVYNVTHTAVSFLCQKVVHILQVDRHSNKSRIEKSLSDNHNNFIIDYETRMVLNSDSPFKRPFQRFSNAVSLNRYIEQKPHYVKPVEISIGANLINNHKAVIHYVPIHETLRQYLCHDDVLNDVQTGPHTERDNLLTYADGSCFTNNMLFSSKPNALQIILYHDDFQVVNPLGNKTNKFKISGFYFMVGNVRPEHQSRLKDIHLAILCNAALLKEYSYATILSPLIEDLKKLENIGFEIIYEGSTHKFFASISMLVADNLAAHAIGGYYQNFSTVERFCRVCNRTKKDISSTDCVDIIRTTEAYDAQVADVERDNSLTKLYGIKESCCLNELEYFHIVDGAPADLAHDVFEGFAIDLVTSLIVYFIKQKLASLSEINDIIETFQYAEIDKANKPQIIKEKSLTKLRVKQTACEMWNLLRLLPLMIGSLIDNNDPQWRNFVDFVDIVKRLCAVKFTEKDLNDLELSIDNFFIDYCTLLPDSDLKPKAHFLTHYTLHIRKFGPLIKTLRFESKHGYFKNSIVASRNHINVCQSMAKHHQMLMYLNYKQSSYFSSNLASTVNSKEKTFADISNQLKDTIVNVVGNPISESFLEARGVTWSGQKYYTGGVVVITGPANLVKLGEILKVYILNGEPFLYCNILTSETFHDHFHAYNVKQSSDLSLINIKDLLDYHPLGMYKIGNQLYVPLHHHIPC